MSGFGRVDETGLQVLIDEFPEGGKFRRREGVDVTERRYRVVLRLNLEIVLAMRGEIEGTLLAEDVGKLTVLGGKTR